MKFLYKFLRTFNFIFISSDARRKFRQAMDARVYGKPSDIFTDNYLSVIEKLKTKKSKIKAVFLVSENQKWNWQSVYDDMLHSPDFEPLVLITNIWLKRKTDIRLSESTLQENYDFFKNKGMNVEYAYDNSTDTYYPLDKFGADIVFYQQPWNIHPIQNLEETSKYALSCYVPYGIPVCDIGSEYDINFYRKVWAYFEINQDMYDFLETKDKDLVKNHVVCGHPKLDTYFNKVTCDKAEKYIIYAPHHSFFPAHLNLATFKWNGEYILNFAKTHPEYKFVFKPHPWLKATIIKRHIMTKDQVENYYNDWKKIGVYCNDADYFDLFKKSSLLLTDCASFIVEYFPSTHPVIHLRNRFSPKFLPFVEKITDCYYKVFDLKTLKTVLNSLLVENNDFLEEKRLKTINNMKFLEQKCSQRILNYLRQCINGN